MTKAERRKRQREFLKGFEPRGLCAWCSKMTEVGVADHIVPVTMGGSWDAERNRQRLCPRCHGKKTQQEWRDPFSVCL